MKLSFEVYDPILAGLLKLTLFVSKNSPSPSPALVSITVDILQKYDE
jgi:hypothetical protein